MTPPTLSKRATLTWCPYNSHFFANKAVGGAVYQLISEPFLVAKRTH